MKIIQVTPAMAKSVGIDLGHRHEGKGIHTVRFNECEGEAGPEAHCLAHTLYDKFAWFDEVQVRQRGPLFIVLIRHTYPEEIAIEDYAKRWVEDKFGEGEARFQLEFRR